MIFYEIKFIFTLFQIATPTEKKVPAPLILSNHSSEFECDKSHSSNNDYPKVGQVTDEASNDDINLEEPNSSVDIKSQENYSNKDNKF